ncbi:DUF1501 domain-containing protein [Verrucomicrobia bacterium]|nr:DUF1501 domain-containing protein [Verrucomicrobiota bacterium]
MSHIQETTDHLLSRRSFFGRTLWGVGAGALTSMMPSRLLGSPLNASFAPRAKRVIYLFMSGAPSQIDLFDHKPKMQDLFDKDLPDSVRQGQRLTTMTSGQSRFPIAPSMYQFARHGQSGTEVSELLPHTAGMVDDIAVVRTVHTDAINHDPAITMIQTGTQLPGKPSLGAWLSYGLGSENNNLPTYVVLNSTWTAKRDAQALYSRLWGSGFLPSKHQGVRLRSQGNPVLYLANPEGVTQETRKTMLDGLGEMNRKQFELSHDPEINARIAQYEMAFRMQTSVPELTDISNEPDHIYDMYGPDAKTPGTFASNCLLARRLVERDVRSIQIFHRGWDQHGDLPRDLPLQCKDIDQGATALVQDLKQRGLLDDTLVVWGGEFGRTIYCQGKLERTDYGRDHHPRCFTMWMAGGGIKGGVTYGTTDDFSYNIAENPVHIRDLNATILHCMGFEHNHLTYKFQGLNQKLTGTDAEANVIKGILA